MRRPRFGSQIAEGHFIELQTKTAQWILKRRAHFKRACVTLPFLAAQPQGFPDEQSSFVMSCSHWPVASVSRRPWGGCGQSVMEQRWQEATIFTSWHSGPNSPFGSWVPSLYYQSIPYFKVKFNQPTSFASPLPSNVPKEKEKESPMDYLNISQLISQGPDFGRAI